jgi:hypothetical protein
MLLGALLVLGLLDGWIFWGVGVRSNSTPPLDAPVFE